MIFLYHIYILIYIINAIFLYHRLRMEIPKSSEELPYELVHAKRKDAGKDINYQSLREKFVSDSFNLLGGIEVRIIYINIYTYILINIYILYRYRYICIYYIDIYIYYIYMCIYILCLYTLTFFFA